MFRVGQLSYRAKAVVVQHSEINSPRTASGSTSTACARPAMSDVHLIAPRIATAKIPREERIRDYVVDITNRNI
jgi:hypothetical protein